MFVMFFNAIISLKIKSKVIKLRFFTEKFM